MNTFVPFLLLVADDIFAKYGNDLSKVTIIAPNKRASLFFNQYLLKHVTDKPLWAPQFTTIGDVFESLCTLKIADPVQQICKLYEAYRKVSGTDESLDKFYSWAELMKNDFENIDNNLANAKMLFSNIEDLEKMKDFSFLSDNQIKAIRTYFEKFNIGRESMLKQKFIGVWQYMFSTYTEYRRILTESGLSYSGMQKRHVIEGIKNGDINLDEHLHEGVYVIIGFNVLNETEKALFKYIKQSRTTLFYWDYDQKYLHSEAGRFVAENIKMFPNEFADHPEYYSHFGTQKSIRFIASPTENAQTRYVSNWMDSSVTDHPLQESVVVLCNENVLQPVLHSIPSSINGQKVEMNVTMGYPLHETPIYSFVLALMNLQMNGIKAKDSWRYSYVATVLKHPYTKRIINDTAINILSHLKKNNKVFPSTKELTTIIETDDNNAQQTVEIPFLKAIFTQAEGHKALIDYLINIVKQIGKSYKDELLTMRLHARLHNKQTDSSDVSETDADNFELQLYIESIFTTYKVLSRVHTLQEREPIFNVNNSTLSRLLIQMLQQKSIPFHGEPAIGLQVMGLLETRNLDFRNVIMLSANEGTLPKSDHMASLIPYSLRETYGMTTIEKQVSLYAFYFYNLLQRAENVTLMYNSTADGLSTGEMTRFMLQLQVESNKILPPDRHIELFSLSALNESQIVTDSVIPKTDEIKKKIKEKKFMSPTAINDYIDCPVKFYFKNVAGFRENDDVSEEVDDPTFGNIFHEAMQLIYEPYVGKQVLPSDIQSWLNKKNFIEDIVDKAFCIKFFMMPEDSSSFHPHYNGEQLLNRYVIIDYVRNQLTFDARFCPMTILGVETDKYSTILLNDNKTEVKIGGIIDRYECLHTPKGDVIRITDYKTNASAQTASTLKSIFESDTKKRAKNYLQALYYCDVLATADNPKKPIKPALMYIKTKVDNRDCDLRFEKEHVTDYVTQYQSRYHELLRDKLSEIYLSDDPFIQHAHFCMNCQFRHYCKK